MNEQKIWTTLKAAGLSDAGAAGLMGNLYAESALIPTNLQNTYERKLGYTDATYTTAVDAGEYPKFTTDAAGYGLAQWTYSARKAKLLAYAKAQGKSIGDLDMQLGFLIKELREDYPGVWVTLTSTANVRAASDVVLLQYERPADTSDRARTLRAGFGEKYFRQFAGQAEEELPNPPCPEKEILTGVLTLGGVTYDITAMKR